MMVTLSIAKELVIVVWIPIVRFAKVIHVLPALVDSTKTAKKNAHLVALTVPCVTRRDQAPVCGARTARSSTVPVIAQQTA